MKYKFYLTTSAGDRFSKVAKKAKEIANAGSFEKIVEFKFNSIIVRVTSTTDLVFLERDYHNAYVLEQNIIGPETYAIISGKKRRQLKLYKITSEKEAKKRAAEYAIEEAKKIAALQAKIGNIVFAENPDSPGAFEEWKAVQKDGYSLRVMDYANEWARLMQYEMATGKELVEMADKASHEADTDGITGAQYYMARSVLTQTWAHGEELKRLVQEKLI